MKNQQKRRLQTLEYFNSVVSDMMANGYKMNYSIMDNISKKKVVNVQDIEQLSELRVNKSSANLYKQDKGEYQPVPYQLFNLDKLKTNKSLRLTEDRSQNVSSSSFDKKIETETRGVKIVVKVHIN